MGAGDLFLRDNQYPAVPTRASVADVLDEAIRQPFIDLDNLGDVRLHHARIPLALCLCVFRAQQVV